MSFSFDKKLNSGEEIFHGWCKAAYQGLEQLWLSSTWPFPFATGIEHQRKQNPQKSRSVNLSHGCTRRKMQFEMLPVINNESPEQKNHFISYSDLAVNGKSIGIDAFDTRMKNTASSMEGWGRIHCRSPWCEEKIELQSKQLTKLNIFFGQLQPKGKASMLSTDNLKGFLAKSPFFIC